MTTYLDGWKEGPTVISMTKTRLGALRCPVAVQMGSGAKAAFGGGSGARWLEQDRQSAHFAVRTVDLIPPFTAYNSTSVSAGRERSP